MVSEINIWVINRGRESIHPNDFFSRAQRHPICFFMTRAQYMGPHIHALQMRERLVPCIYEIRIGLINAEREVTFMYNLLVTDVKDGLCVGIQTDASRLYQIDCGSQNGSKKGLIMDINI